MPCKHFRIFPIILTLILMVTIAGCGSRTPSGSGAKAANNVFDYGITVNIPESWNPDAYKATAEENPEHWYGLQYPLLYGVHYEYIKGNETFGLFGVYVLNEVDWNEIELSRGEAPGFGYLIKKAGGFAYVISDLPHENPFENPADSEEFNAMCEFMWAGFDSGFDKLAAIGATDKKPTVTESRNKTVVCDYGYYGFNIPTTWDYNDLIITNTYDADFEGYMTYTMTQYSFKTGPDTSENVFTALLFTNDEWAKIEAETEGPPIAVKIKVNDEYTLAVLLPQDNPIDPNSEAGKKFDAMQMDIRNFDAFFILYILVFR